MSAPLKPPYGPPPPTFPSLSDRALLFFWAQLYMEETRFLSLLPTYYELHGASPLDQGCAFECLAFAAGLKECLMLGWGDGRTEGHRKVAEVWMKTVWENVLKVFRAEGMELDEDARAVRQFMEGCKTHQLGKLSTESAIQEGHTVLYHEPVSPAFKLVMSIPSDSPRSTLLEESILALILDYPAPIPPFRYFETHSPREHRVSVTYHISATGPWCGTQYFVHRNNNMLKNRVMPHYLRYANKLHKVVMIGLSLDEKKPTCVLEPYHLENVGMQCMNVKVYQLDNLTAEGRRNPNSLPALFSAFGNLSLGELREPESEAQPEDVRRGIREEKDRELRRRGEQVGFTGTARVTRSMDIEIGGNTVTAHY